MKTTIGICVVSAQEYGYDRLAWVENERGERYTFERDPNGEVIAECGFDGRERRYERDMDGTVLVTHLPDGTTIHHQHDLAGRLTYSRYPDGSWEAWEYDRAGRLCKASNPHGETVFERDALGRIVREVRDGHTIEHSYDSRSRLVRTHSGLGVDITHSYDDTGLPESVKAIVQGMPHPWEARLQHDRLGRETLRTMTGGVACAMQYDGVGRPSRQSVTRGGHSLYNRSYRWDDDFRLSHAHDAISGRIARYFYDDFGSLAEAEYGDGARQWRNPDVMGNVYDSADRTDRTYARGGQLREDRRWRYHYDKQGNLVLKTKRKIPPSAETPQDTIKQGTTTVSPKAWHKVSKPKRKRKVIAASALQPAEKVAVVEKKAEPAVVQETPKEQPKQQTGIEPESDDVVIDTAEIIREPKPRRIFSHKRFYQTRIGIRAGVGYSVIANLGALVEDGAVRPRYTMEENGAFVPSIGVFALWRHDRLGVKLAADYTWLSSTLKEHKQIGNIDEKTVFRYHVIMPQVAARLYLLSDLYMGAGVGMSIPLNPGGIDFSSNRAALYVSVDKLTQEHLRETFRARLHVMPLLKIGYSSFKNGIEASLQYGYGIMDLIKTNENPYGYHKATNNSHLLLLTVGYTIPLTKQK